MALGDINFGVGTQLAAPTNPNAQGGASQFISNFNASHPQMNLTTGAFQNALNSGNTAAAMQMLQAGGGQFQDAVRQAMGWNQQQFAQFANNADLNNKGSYAGYNPATLQQYGATMATPQAGNLSNATNATNPGQFTLGQGQDVNTGYGLPAGAPTGYGALADGGAPPATIGSLASGAQGAGSMGAGLGGALGGGPVSSAPNGPGSFNSGLSPIAGTQPNYPLDVGAYLNPMMQYSLQQGVNTINNSAAAAGSLNSGDTMKQLMAYGEGVGANNYNNAAQIAAGQQAFGYGVDNNDRNFAYNAQQNDRNFNENNLLAQAGLGLQGLGQQSTNDRTLATILAQLGLSGANAASTGTIGAGNAITQAIQQALAGTIGAGAGGH